MEEAITRGALPRIHWGAVIAGALVAIAVQVVLGLFGIGFGFAAESADSGALGVVSVVWNLLVPLVASGLGAIMAVRMASASAPVSAYLHGAIVWSIGLLVGAIFLSNTLAAGVLSSPDSTRAVSRPTAGRSMTDDQAKTAAAGSALGGLAAIFGLIGAIGGAEIGRRELTGEFLSGRRHRGYAPRADVQDIREGRDRDLIDPGPHPH
jgi:hypothetical protein